MKRQDFRFLHRLRVRWAEVDMQHIVFNAHYLLYFDVAVTEYWRALALPYQDAMALLGGELYLRKAEVDYRASARMDDLLDVGIACDRIGHTSMSMSAAVFRGEQCLVSATLVYVFADPATQTSTPIPAALRALMLDHENGEPVLRLVTGGWSELESAARQVRSAVFVDEQGIDREDEWDEADAHALHAVAFNQLGQPVGTGRLLPSEAGQARIGRMAVHRALRDTGVGRLLLEALLERARARGDLQACLSAQRSAEPFYARQGFEIDGEPFEEVGIPHIGMRRPL